MSRFHKAIPHRRWEIIRREALERDGWRCRECGKAGRLEVHHLEPLHKGGSNDVGNLVALCRSCHIQAHRRPVSAEQKKWQEFAKELLPP